MGILESTEAPDEAPIRARGPISPARQKKNEAIDPRAQQKQGTASPTTPPPAFTGRVIPQSTGDKTIVLNVLSSARADPQFLTYQHQLLHAGYKVDVHAVDSLQLKEIARTLHRDDLKVYENTQRMQAIIREIFENAAKRMASDIHIEVRGNFCSVVFRLNGNLTSITEYSRADGEALQRAIYQGYSKGDASYTRHIYQAAQIQHDEDPNTNVVPGAIEALRMQRGPLYPDGEYTVLRLLYRKRRQTDAGPQAGRRASGTGPEDRGRVRPPPGTQPKLGHGLQIFEEFGYTHDQALILARCTRAPEGMVVFSGPTGSAKSSALKVALEFQHTLYPQKSIFTIEDPPEYEITGAKQLAVLNAHGEAARKSGFSEALRVVLRSDPDILMVGEIRDEATAGAALDAVITGHQMWTTVHAMDPYLIITRLLRFGLDMRDFLDATILRALVGQRLIGVVCKHCAVPLEGHEHLLDEDILKPIHALCARSGQSPAQIRLRPPAEVTRQCTHCHGTGIGGRKIVSEVVEVDDEFIARIRDGTGVNGARTWTRARPGHISILRHGIHRMFAGEADPREIISIVGNLNAEAPDDPAILATPVERPGGDPGHGLGESADS